MTCIYDPRLGIFESGDAAREIELGERVMDTDYWGNETRRQVRQSEIVSEARLAKYHGTEEGRPSHAVQGV